MFLHNIKHLPLGWAASAGLAFLQFCNLNSFRTKFIIGFALFMGLSVPQYFNEYLLISSRGAVHTRVTWVRIFNFVIGSSLFNFSYGNLKLFWLAFLAIQQHHASIFSSPATVAVIAAFLLDTTLSRGHSSTRQDNGMHWWEKFRYFNQDTRSEEFYALPYNLNRFFPSSWLSSSCLPLLTRNGEILVNLLEFVVRMAFFGSIIVIECKIQENQTLYSSIAEHKKQIWCCILG